MNARRLVIVALFAAEVASALIASLAPSVARAAPTADELLKPYGISVKEPETFAVKKNVEQKSDGRVIHHLHLQKAETEIELVVLGPVDEAKFKSYAAMESASFQRLFKPVTTPYPGKLDGDIICPAKYQPIKSSVKVFGVAAEAFSSKASARKSFGVCIADSVAYDAAFALVRLPSGYAVKATVFLPSKAPDKIATGFFQSALENFSAR